MHPDQRTPDSHRYQTPDSLGDAASSPETPPSAKAPESPQPDLTPERDAAPAASEVDEGARVAEAGNAYVGRELDDALKSSPRVEDGDEAVDTDPTTARDD